MSSLYGRQSRRRFLAGAAAAATGAVLFSDCGGRGSPLAPEETETAAKAAAGVLKSIRVYEAVHVPITWPASPLDALEAVSARPLVEERLGQPFVSAVNRRRGTWVFAIDGEFPEGGRIARLGNLALASPAELERFSRGSMQAVLADRTAGPSRYHAAHLFYAWPWQRTLISWLRVSLV